MLFIQESKLEVVNPRLWRSLAGHGPFSGDFVSSVGTVGGLITLWNEKFFTIEEKVSANRFMLLVGSIKSKNFRCGFGNIYAPNDDRERQAFWMELGSIIKGFDIPWCLGGDFNAVRNKDEKIGVVQNSSSMSHFSLFIDDIGYMDLPMSGGKFTWCSNRRDPSYSRLDRFLIFSEFMLVFQQLVRKCLPRSLSDHNAVLLMVESTNWGPKPFKFFNH